MAEWAKPDSTWPYLILLFSTLRGAPQPQDDVALVRGILQVVGPQVSAALGLRAFMKAVASAGVLLGMPASETNWTRSIRFVGGKARRGELLDRASAECWRGVNGCGSR